MRVIIKDYVLFHDGAFWTGEIWTSCRSFAFRFTKNEAVKIVAARFSKRKPGVQVRHYLSFQKRTRYQSELRNNHV